MANNQDYSSLKVAVGTSTKKDAYTAGKEIAEKTLHKLGCMPNLFLAFCTINYEDNGGLSNFLKGIWSVLPEETVLAGGTITGFLNSDGCYASGATALGINYPNMNISIGHGSNTKRNPKKAARKCIKMIKEQEKNQYSEKILMSFISSTKNPQISLPGMQDVSFINSKILARLSLFMVSFFQKFLKKGIGKEQEVLEEITKNLPNYNLIHASMTCWAPYDRNFQFLNKNIFKDDAVIVLIESDIPLHLDFSTGAKKSDIKFKITKISKDKIIIKEINNKPAFTEFLKIMNWTEKTIGDFKWTDRGVRYPIAFEKNSRIILRPHLLIMGDFMGAVGKIEYKDVFIADMSSEAIANATVEVLKPKKPLYGFFSSCFSQRDFLGIKVFQVQEKLKKYFQEKPFLMIYVGGEAIHKPDECLYYLNESLSSAIFHEN